MDLLFGGKKLDAIIVNGGKPLSGTARIQGSKNASLPILTGSVLIPGKTVLHNCPRISDVFLTIEILKNYGCKILWEEDTLTIDSTHLCRSALADTNASLMRSSISFLGALLGRMKEVELPYPGGCVIGERPIDLHVSALEKMGAYIVSGKSVLSGKTEHLHGADISLRISSVGATENIILAAVTAEGVTTIRGAAKEPEIVSLCEFLSKAGAMIRGAGTNTIEIEGNKLHETVEYAIPSDRIVAGTYAFATAITGGTVTLKQFPFWQLEIVIDILRKMGCELKVEENQTTIRAASRLKNIEKITTEIYPGFPTDLQSQALVCMCIADGDCIMEENIFEGRFKVADELQKNGSSDSGKE